MLLQLQVAEGPQQNPRCEPSTTASTTAMVRVLCPCPSVIQLCICAYIYVHTCMHAQACIQEPVRALLQRQVAEQRQQKLQIEPVSTGSTTAKVPALCPCPSVICYNGIHMCMYLYIYIAIYIYICTYLSINI